MLTWIKSHVCQTPRPKVVDDVVICIMVVIIAKDVSALNDCEQVKKNTTRKTFEQSVYQCIHTILMCAEFAKRV